MDAAFAARFPFEMFDNIRDVGLFAIDARRFHRIVEQATGWSDERFAREIFFVTRLLADKQDVCSPGTFAKNRLRSFLPEVAGTAAGGCVFD